MSRGIFEVNLICSNAETPHHNQILCFPKDPLIELGFWSDTDYVDIAMERQ